MAENLLIDAAREGDLERVRNLLIDGMNVNVVNENCDTALNWAACGRFEIVSLLIESGARIDHQNNGGWTALHYASAKYRIAIVSLLIEKGADINIKSKAGFTALMRSALQGCTPIVSLLLDNGADASLLDNDGKTALDLARQYNKPDCVMILENYEHFHRHRKTWLSFSTSLRSFQDNQYQESKQFQSQSQSQTQSPSLMRVMDSSDLVRYLTEYM